jgi:hypothetical protein
VSRAERLRRLFCGENAALAMRQAIVRRTGTSQDVEDLKHFCMECPVYDDLRARCMAFSSSSHNQLQSPNRVAQVPGHTAQTSLAHVVHYMTVVAVLSSWVCRCRYDGSHMFHFH